MSSYKKTICIIFLVIIIISFCVTGCRGDADEVMIKISPSPSEMNTLAKKSVLNTLQLIPRPSPVIIINPDSILYEAENAKNRNLTLFSDDGPLSTGYNGDGYMGSTKTDKDRKLIFEIDIAENGLYEITILAAASKENQHTNIIINGDIYENAIYTANENFMPSIIKVYLNDGSNKIILNENWDNLFVDYLLIKKIKSVSRSIYDVKKTLVNENAAIYTKRLMSYLVDQYGVNTLSGQYQVNGGFNSKEFQAIFEITGRYPAIMGLDFIDYSPSRVENGATSTSTEDAIAWHELGGIVKFLWHWNAPKELVDTKRNPWWKGFYTKGTMFNLDDALNGSDPEGYELLIRDIDVISEQLKILKDNNVPVLWRPIHEASGEWFWWGAYGPENFKKLWIIMYERMTYDNGLNNLIWIYNGESADWYPGDEYVDIIGEDIYADSYDYDIHEDIFEFALTYTDTKKIIALSENGVIPDPDIMYNEDVCWSFFATWCDEFVIDRKTGKPTDKYMDFEYIKRVYNHSKIITLDELPDLSIYPIQ